MKEAKSNQQQNLKLNQMTSLDPDFGQGIRENCIWHLVHVTPVKKEVEPYDLLVFLPAYPFHDAGISVVQSLMNQFLEDLDQYEVCQNPGGHGPIDGHLMPKIVFAPHKPDEFFWLQPPRHLWH